jgi:hypothetical protein
LLLTSNIIFNPDKYYLYDAHVLYEFYYDAQSTINVIFNFVWFSGFVTEPSDKVVAEGQSLTLNCQATDSNGRLFGINWKRNDVWLLDPSNKPWQLLRNNSLYYRSITAQDVGQFLCAASVTGTQEIKYSRKAKVQLACE